MKITWVTRSFLDYRIPLYKALNALCGEKLTVIYNADVVPQRCQDKLEAVLGERAIGLHGELRWGGSKVDNASFANKGFRIPIQKGLFKQIISTQPDVLITDGFFQWTYSAYMAKVRLQIPHIMLYERTPHTERDTPKWRQFARKAMLPLINQIGCNGSETYTYLKDTLKVNPKKLFLGNMAADNSALAERVKAFNAETYKTKTSIDFLYVGQLIERKGILPMLMTWKNFEDTHSEVKLTLIGDGDQLEVLQDYVTTHHFKSVSFLGKIDYEDVVKYYAQADIFIIPTLEDNWSLVVPEAMSCGLPILCSKYNGCWPELVQDTNGWVFDPLDAANFKAVLRKAYHKKDQWEAMGEASQAIVKDYAPEAIAAKIFETCKTLVS
jgi:glycosyltransferase involved in cell wall biosynthesis